MIHNMFCKGCRDDISAPVDAKAHESTAEILQRMDPSSQGRFVVESQREWEALLSTTEDDAHQQRLKSVEIRFTPHQLPKLSLFPNLVSLDLSRASIGSGGASAVTSFFVPKVLPQSITSLDLSNNGIRVAGAIGLSLPGVLPPKLTSLNLQGNGLGNEGAQKLLDSKVLSKLNELTYLDLGSNKIIIANHVDVSSWFVPGAFPPGLKELKLNGNKIFCRGVAALCRPGVLSKELVRLDLENTGIRSAGVMYLSNANLPKLEYLSLKNNSFTPDGVAYLSVSGFMRTSLTHLDLEYWRVGPDGAKHLVDNSESFEKLQSLILSFNNFGSDKVRELRGAFRDAELKLDYNDRIHLHNPSGYNWADAGINDMDVEEYRRHTLTSNQIGEKELLRQEEQRNEERELQRWMEEKYH